MRFRREVAAAQKVNGLYTALVVDADVDGPVPWLATAYVAGPSLAEAVASNGPLPAASVLVLAAALAEGLGAIHAVGLVHRDLKPSNVLLADEGPRVIDFGISRAAEASVLTHTGLVVGSPGFMSPEQAEGGEVGPPSDVFSLGAVLTFAASGHGPFGIGSTAALIYRVVHSSPDLDGVPPEIQPLIQPCLAKDPRQRPSTGDLLAELGTRKIIAILTDPGKTPTADTLAFAPSGTTLAVGDKGSTYLWDVATRKVTATLTDPGSSVVTAVAFGPGGTTLAVGEESGRTYLWDVATRTLTATVADPGKNPTVNTVAIAPGGTTLAVGDGNGSTYLWYIPTRKLTATLTDPRSSGVTAVAFGPGITLAAGDENGSTYLWHITSRS
jgi:serine/threonine protein kinase